LLLALFCAGRGRLTSDHVQLVDGGVYDNLGAAFSLLTDDDRYPALGDQLGVADEGLLLVVDASKQLSIIEPARRSRLTGLIPLRLLALHRLARPSSSALSNRHAARV
jgi:hypothetical protein